MHSASAQDQNQILHKSLQRYVELLLEASISNAADVVDSTAAHKTAMQADSFPAMAEPGQTNTETSQERAQALARYFNAYHSISAADDVVSRLQRGVWENVRAALRYAHHGDAAKAKLHLQIVGNGCQELSKFVEADVCLRFQQEMTEYTRLSFQTGDNGVLKAQHE